MQFRSPAGLVAGLVVLACAAPAAAAGPATVQLRVEGADRTLYEGTLTTDGRDITMRSGPTFGGTYPGGTHTCNGLNGANAGGYGGPGATPTTALADAAAATGFAWYGPYNTGLDDFFIASIAGEGSLDGPYWDVRTNGTGNARGGCQIQLQTGDEVLYALGTYGQPALELAGPVTARPGEAFAVRVTDEEGAAVAGAAVGGATTGADGTASLRLDGTGPRALKAEKAGAIRSNRLDVCLTNGADGACGTSVPPPPGLPPGADVPPPAPDTSAPAGRIRGIRESQEFRGRGPRKLRGTVSADPSGVKAVRLRLTRQHRGRCSRFSARKERFVRRPCGRRTSFVVSREPRWSYLLPKKLGKGRYVLDVIAVDRAGNRDVLERGRSRVVFRVR